MQTKLINQAENSVGVPGAPTMDIRHISEQQLAALGVSQIAYLKPAVMDGVNGVSIHAADGTPIAFAGDLAIAEALVVQHEMYPLLVH
jgi:hypothetical protein